MQYGEHFYTSMVKKSADHVESFNMDDPEVELEVTQEAEFDDFMFLMEEDPEMYAAAGLPVPTTTPTATPSDTPTANPIDLGSTVKSVMDSVSEMKAANVNISCQFYVFKKNLILFKMLYS